MDISTYLKKRGYLTVDAAYRSKVDEWLDWYQGDVENFHAYSVYNGIQKVGVRRASLQMAKCIAEDWANLLLNERVAIHAGGFQKRLEELLQKNRFTVRGNQLIELAFALGTGAFVEYLSGDNEPVIDCIRADLVHPLAWDNGVVTECAFGGVRVIRQKECCYLQLHVLDENGTYSIENHLFDNETDEELSLEEYCPDLAPKVETGSETPLFQIITPNITNNFDLDCPMGASVYANAISTLRSLDLAYDSYTNEFALGRKRIMVPITMAKIQMTKDGTAQPIFDSNDVAFYAMQLPEGAMQEIKDISPPIRAAEHEQGIRLMLNLISKKCGLGNDRYQFEAGGVKTATEVISEKSDLYQNLRKHELLLGPAIVDMVKALAFLDGAAEPDAQVSFDDSIINDDNTKLDNNIKLVQAELKSRLAAIMEINGCSKKDAQKELNQITEENRRVSGSDMDLFGAESDEDDGGQKSTIGFSVPDEEEEETEGEDI